MGGEEGIGVTTGQPNLYKQDLSKLDVSKLTALSPEVISRQATINIGTIGHVAHGKSTIVKAISGVQTVRFKNELERNITIKLDAHAMEDTSGMRPDNADETTRLHTKRKHTTPRSGRQRKQVKIHETSLSNTEDSFSETSSRISDTSSNFSDISRRRSRRLLKEYEAEHNEVNSHRTSTDDLRLSNGIGNMKLHSNCEQLNMKDLRVMVEDIKASKIDNSEDDTKDEDVWEAEQIIEKKERKNKTFYLIKWKNWSSKHNTWEPAENLLNCEDILREYEDSKVQLLDGFKEKVNFYPTTQDVEQYLMEIQYKGESIDCTPTEQEEIYSSIRLYLKNTKRSSKLEIHIKCNILRMLLCKFRKEQLESLKDWEDEMNAIAKGKPTIHVENSVDLECAPENFFYIDDYLPGAGVVIPNDPPIGCECTSCDSKAKCCFAQADGSFPYTSAGRVRIPPGTPIYECNKRCSCSQACLNRVVQRGTTVKLCIFRTSNGRGWGVKTLRAIKKGTFVTDYVGEVITNEEAEKRGKEYDAAGRTYLFDLDYNETEEQCPYTVDAAMFGNISHFINHSCDPNLAVYGVWINCLDPNLPKIALFATRDIKANEELTFDYLCQSSGKAEQSMQEETELDSAATNTENMEKRPETPESEASYAKTLCKCGAENCRQFLF